MFISIHYNPTLQNLVIHKVLEIKIDGVNFATNHRYGKQLLTFISGTVVNKHNTVFNPFIALCGYFFFRQRIYTGLPGGSPCIKIFIYTAAVQEAQLNRLCTRLPGVNIKLLFTRQQFQSQFRYIRSCHVST